MSDSIRLRISSTAATADLEDTLRHLEERGCTIRRAEDQRAARALDGEVCVLRATRRRPTGRWSVTYIESGRIRWVLSSRG